MKSRPSSRSGLFLMELIIAIAFFALASAFCVQFFAKAHMTGQKSEQLAIASNIARNAAESFKAMSAQEIERLTAGQNTLALTAYYNDSGQRLHDAQGTYRMEMQIEAVPASLYTAGIDVYKTTDSMLIYSIKTGNYTAVTHS